MRLPLIATLSVFLAGCGAASIKGATAEQQIKAANAAYKTVRCPKDISAAQGATFTCTATTKKGDYLVTVQVDSVAGGKAHLSFVKAEKQAH